MSLDEMGTFVAGGSSGVVELNKDDVVVKQPLPDNGNPLQNEIETLPCFAAIGTLLGGGSTGVVELTKDGVAIKRPYPSSMEDAIPNMEIEARIYQHLGPHARVVRFLLWDAEQSMLHLEYMKNGTLKEFLSSGECSVSHRLRWVKQAGDAIQLLHSRQVIHCDIKPANFLLDENLDLKICDFAGSSLFGSKAFVCTDTRFAWPKHWKDPSHVQEDIFALGSTIFTIMTGREPYEEIESDEVKSRFSQAEFPDTRNVIFGDVIQTCWSGQASMEEVCSSIETSIQQLERTTGTWSVVGGVLGSASSLYEAVLKRIASFVSG